MGESTFDHSSVNFQSISAYNSCRLNFSQIQSSRVTEVKLTWCRKAAFLSDFRIALAGIATALKELYHGEPVVSNEEEKVREMMKKAKEALNQQR